MEESSRQYISFVLSSEEAMFVQGPRRKTCKIGIRTESTEYKLTLIEEDIMKHCKDRLFPCFLLFFTLTIFLFPVHA